MFKKFYTHIFITLILILSYLCWKEPNKEKIFCYFASLIAIQISLLKSKSNKLKYSDKLYK